MTFNIKHGTNRAGHVDLPLLARTCARFGADLLAVQEVDRRAVRSRLADQVRLLERATGLRSTFGEAACKFLARQYGNALLARGEIDDVEVVSLPQPESGEHRVVILATVRLDCGPRLSVATTHLSFRRGEGGLQLDVTLGLLARRPPPRVLLGDLNLRPDVVEPVAVAAGYQLAGTGPTFPAAKPRIRIDYVAVQGLEVLAADAPDTPASDHRPVVADVRATAGGPPD